MGPVPPDEVSVPAQQGTRGDDQAQLAELAAVSSRASAAMTARSAQDSPGVLTCRWSTATLMTQDEDLDVLGAVGTGQQGEPAEHAQHHG
jgi:hypothetical protein